MQTAYVVCQKGTVPANRCRAIFLDIEGKRTCPSCKSKHGKVLYYVGENKRMDFDQALEELLTRITNCDGVVITSKDLIRAALQNAYTNGLQRASNYVRDEVGQEYLAEEIKALHSCL